MSKIYMNHLELYFDRDDLEKIRMCDDLYLKSAVLVRSLFQYREDKVGRPYLKHLLGVSNRMTSLDGVVAGLLHAVVEVIPNVDFDDLLDIGISEHIVEVLRLVTEKHTTRKLSQGEKLNRYNQEINQIIASGNNLALELKIADISDDYSPERQQYLSVEQLSWFNQKYAKNLEKLEKEREKRKKKC